MAKRVVFFNGDFISEQEARVSIFDSALMFGDMAFEVTRTFAGKPYRLRRHLERLYASLRLLEIDCGMSIDEMEEHSLATLERNQVTEPAGMDWQIMHDVSRGPTPLYRSVFPEGLKPTVVISSWPILTHVAPSAADHDLGVNLAIVPQQAMPAHLVDAKAKTRSRMHYRMAMLQGQRIGQNTWPLMLDPDSYLAEGPGWNIFLVKDGALFTPQPRNILLGVSRDTTMTLARKLGISVHEANLGQYEALQADEIFITSTPWCIMWATSFEGRTIGDGQLGPIYDKLLEAWKHEVGIDFVAQAHDYAEQLPQWEKRQQPDG